MAQRLLAATTRNAGAFVGRHVGSHTASLPRSLVSSPVSVPSTTWPPAVVTRIPMRQPFSSLLVYDNVLEDLSSCNLRQTPEPKAIQFLATLYKQGDLNLNPKYQRGYVWGAAKASRLIVTALCGRFIPGVVLHEIETGRYDVIDGKQRLISLLSFFMAGDEDFLLAYNRLKASQPEGTELPEQLKLKDENYEGLTGLTFKKLSEERQRAFKNFSVACIKIPPDSSQEDNDRIFLVYEDINSGGLDLTAQQLRRAAFYGPYIELLDELAKNEDFQCIRDPQAFHDGKYKICNKDHDRELILRAFAFSRDNGEDLKGKSLKLYLNRELESLNRDMDERTIERIKEKKRSEFAYAMRVWRNVFGSEAGAFHEYTKVKGKWNWNRNRRNGTSVHLRLWEVTYAVLAELRVDSKESQYLENQASVVEAIKGLFHPSPKLDLSAPTAIKFAKNKRTITSAIRSCLDPLNTEPRSFSKSPALRQELFTKQGGKCNLCGSEIDERRINDGDYVHLDHIMPYSKGGPSTNDNAALTHSVCNLKKGAKD